ncbi:MAG: TonB protein [Gemmatimonadetes bacterium]|nr:TonB protein [Gemmatimonadota bacterium]
MTSYARRSPLWNAGVVSVAAHALLIGGAVVGTAPPPSMSRESFANRVYYLPPPDRPQVARGSREAVHYITLAEGLGTGPGPAAIDARRAIGLTEHSRDAGQKAVDSVTAPPLVGEEHGDSVFTVLEVDSAVVRTQSSAAPAYPLDLLTKHVEGAVTARYIVDTTGFADPESFVVLKSTNDGFVRAVQAALPYMRFSPAKIGTTRVRQLVEQIFTFRINSGDSAPVAGPKP